MDDILEKMVSLYEDELPERTLAQIRAARSFFGPASSVTFQNALSEEMTLANISKRKLEWQLSLAHSNPLLLSSNTSQESGKEIVKRNDYWEFHSQE
jgi:hypothetical protein